MATVHSTEDSTHTGWIEDTNRWNLERPPDWFLTGLTGYDAHLVIIPSRLKRQYLLCRRRQYSAGLGDVAMLDNRHPDTNMCHGYGVVPISPLEWKRTNSKAGSFTQANLTSLIETLRERDTWAHGGGPLSSTPDAAADAWLAGELSREQQINRSLTEDLRHRARDGWRSLTARLGARNKRASDYHGTARVPAVKSGGVILTDT